MMITGLRAARIAALLSLVAGLASAQLISIKTVPIAQGDQFRIFPSNNLGMAGLSIALADSLQDPFTNPGTGARIGAARFFGAPTVYSLSRGTGGGRSLPLAALARRGRWYGGLALALQQVEASRSPDQRGGIALTPPSPPPLPGGVGTPVEPEIPGPDNQAHGNHYVFAMLGRSTEGPDRRLSVGVSALWTGLHAIDGVDLLYAGSRRVAQSGHALDMRLGLLKEWGPRSLEAVLLHNRFAADHNVTYVDVFWDPGTEQFASRARTELNSDRTNTWGMHLKYAVPLTTTGWRVGWLATVNRLSHPKIPEYELASVPAIPRDPGYSSAYNLGMGISKTRGPATFGVDLVYEPIRSYTWADAAAPVITAAGETIAMGGKTIENRFRFSNALLRIGAGRDAEQPGAGKTVGWQLGLVLRRIHYTLKQTDNVELARRSFETGWIEWTPTWGLTFRFPELELRYRGQITQGAGRPGFAGGIIVGAREMAVAGNSILAAPTGPLFLTSVSTMTHQISLSVPLR